MKLRQSQKMIGGILLPHGNKGDFFRFSMVRGYGIKCEKK
jgi:hypothetical protein